MVLRIKVTPVPAKAVLALAEPLLHSRMAGTVFAILGRAARTVAVVASLAVCANSSATLPAELLQAPDRRFVRLELFFQHYNCPAPQHILEYLQAADGYGLDYRLLPALSIRETQCGITETQNNRWGYHPGRQSFPSIEAGIDYVARQLAENPIYKGKTLHQKLYTYNPLPAYPDEVKRIMRQIE